MSKSLNRDIAESSFSDRSNLKLKKLLKLSVRQVQNMILRNGKAMETIEYRKPKDPIEV